MKKLNRRLLSLLMSIAMVICLLPTFAAAATFSGGDGTEGNPYQIATAADLAALSAAVNDGSLSTDGVYFEQTADITLSGTWISIGTGNNFEGSYNGGNFSITGLNGTNGLFGSLACEENRTVRLSNIHLVDPVINSTADITGAIAGGFAFNFSQMNRDNRNLVIDHCIVEGGQITSSGKYTGGIIGETDLGLLGENNALTITNCIVKNTAITGGRTHTGGIIGANYFPIKSASIKNCAVIGGSVSGQINVGGIAAVFGKTTDSVMESCFVTASVTGTSSAAGGLIGRVGSTAEINDCYTTGDVTGSDYVGGLIGQVAGSNSQQLYQTVTNSFSASAVVSTYDNTSALIGGLIGGQKQSDLTISNSVAMNPSLNTENGAVAADYKGRILGSGTSFTLTNNHGLNLMIVDGEFITSDDASGRQGADVSPASLKTKAFWSGLGFDFDTVWIWNGTDDAGYLTLQDFSVTQDNVIPEQPPLQFSVQPSPVTVYPYDEEARFTAIAVGDLATIAYQWQSSVSGAGDWADMQGENSNKLTVSVEYGQPNLYYKCVVTDKDTPSGISSDTVTATDLAASEIPVINTFSVSDYNNSTIVFLPSPAFSSSTEDYTLALPDSLTNLKIYLGDDNTEPYRYKCITYDGSASIVSESDYAYPSPGYGRNIAVTPDIQTIMLDVVNQDSKRVFLRYTFDIEWMPELSDMTVSDNFELSTAFSSGLAEYNGFYTGDSFTITPTAQSATSTITVNDVACESGSTATVNVSDLAFSEGSADLDVVVSNAGAGYITNTYTITVRPLPQELTPEFIIEDMTPEAVIINRDSSPSELNVKATASDDVTYQWYKNTSDDTVNGTAVEGATSGSFTPDMETAGIFYYYCVAQNTAEGGGSAASGTVEITVYPDPTPVVTVKTPGAALTPLPGIVFTENTGFHYDVGAENPTALDVEYSSAIDSMSEFQGAYEIKYMWTVEHGDSIRSLSQQTTSSRVPFVNGDYLGANYYHCKVIYYLDGRTFSTDSDKIYVHVETPLDYSGVDAYFSGSGTQADPWQLWNFDDFERLAAYVRSGFDFSGMFLEMKANVTLDSTWSSIGSGSTGGASYGYSGPYLRPFSGTLDGGGNTLTYAYGLEKPLFKYVRYATVRNLDIYGEYIANYGLVSDYLVDYGATGDSFPDTIDIINVTIKRGTVIKYSGFIGGYASGGNTVNIINCVAEQGVKIGYDATTGQSSEQSGIGSFGGQFNGKVQNSVSSATVYGIGSVGGLVGEKGQSMGACSFANCAFDGEIVATGNYVGGIIGRGYTADSAPNTPAVSVQNCYVTGTISGLDYVGGIFGGEILLLQCWNNGIGNIRNNHFAGTISATGDNVGGIIGYMHSLNRYNIISNNYYIDNCGAGKGIGNVRYIDTSNSGVDKTDTSVTYFNTANGTSGISGAGQTNHNRTDDPLGADADKLTKAVTATEMSDGTVTALLNAGTGSYGNWVQGDLHPEFSDEAVAIALTLGGAYKTDYIVGDTFTTAGMTITAYYSDGTSSQLTAGDVNITGYNTNVRGSQTVTVSYGAAAATYTITVLYQDTGNSTITVYFTLLGADIHEGEGEIQTLSGGNLQTWIPRKAYTVSVNATVWDVFQEALSEADPETEGVFTSRNPSGNYIEAIYKDGVELAEFTNGDLSGWMYTLNGTHPMFGVSEQYLEANDAVVFHYTDDYTKEEGTENWGTPGESDDDGTSATLIPTTTVTNGNASANVDKSNIDEILDTAEEDGITTIKINAKTDDDVTKSTVTLASGSASDIAGAGLDLTVETSTGTFDIDNSALQTIAGAGSGDVALTAEELDAGGLSDANQALVGDHPVFDLGITVGGSAVTDFGDGTVTVSLPYTPADGEEPANLTVYYIDGDGNAVEMTGAVYDEETGMIVFETDHFSVFAVVYEDWTNPFSDVSTDDWFYDEVKFVATNGLFNGTGDTVFAPDMTMTRAMFATVLYRLEGEPAVTAENPFDDVEDGEWYTNAVIWANENGIVEGYGGGLFGTNDDITREQMAKMLYSYADYKGYDVTAAADLAAYTDADEISDWALAAMRWANAEEVITGRTATTLVPLGDATRAEVATIFMRFVETL